MFVIILCDGRFPSARSKNELYLTYPLMCGGFGASGVDTYQSPSRFLSEIPKGLLNEWNLR